MAELVHLEIQPSEISLAALAATVKRLQAETGRSAADAVGYAAVRVARSGQAASKFGRQQRRVIDNPEWKQAKGSFAWARKQQRAGKAIPAEAQAALSQANEITPYLIERLTQGRPIMLPSWDKQDPRRKVPMHRPGDVGGRGLAKATWSIMGAKMAAMRGSTNLRTETGSNYRVSKYQERYGQTSGSVVARLVNKLSYLEKAYPGITQTAISKGTAALKHELDNRIAAAVARANSKAA